MGFITEPWLENGLRVTVVHAETMVRSPSDPVVVRGTNLLCQIKKAGNRQPLSLHTLDRSFDGVETASPLRPRRKWCFSVSH
jgi:hypothetical protein